MSYPRGKNGAGVYQTIINLIPPHATYIEAFAGSASVFFNKKRAVQSHLIELSDASIQSLHDRIPADPAVCLWNEDALKWLSEWEYSPSTFVYLDPPYLMDTLKSGKIYEHEFDECKHISMLLLANLMDCDVMISGYPSALYEEHLDGWNRFEYQAMTRSGLATEVLWMNYAPPTVLHDTRYLGDDYRERERINRKRNRWQAKFRGLDARERIAIFSDLTEVMNEVKDETE